MGDRKKQRHGRHSSLRFPDVLVLKPKRFQDSRGFFCESYSKRRLAEAGLDVDFVQDNLSRIEATPEPCAAFISKKSRLPKSSS